MQRFARCRSGSELPCFCSCCGLSSIVWALQQHIAGGRPLASGPGWCGRDHKPRHSAFAKGVSSETRLPVTGSFLYNKKDRPDGCARCAGRPHYFLRLLTFCLFPLCLPLFLRVLEVLARRFYRSITISFYLSPTTTPPPLCPRCVRPMILQLS